MYSYLQSIDGACVDFVGENLCGTYVDACRLCLQGLAHHKRGVNGDCWYPVRSCEMNVIEANTQVEATRFSGYVPAGAAEIAWNRSFRPAPSRIKGERKKAPPV
jgi:hypothetical protein